MTSTVLPYASVEEYSRLTVGRRYALLGMLCLAATIAYVQRSGVGGVSANPIRAEFELDTFWFGLVMSAWSLGYAVVQIPSGWLADRWGSRRALTAYALLWSALTCITALATGFASLLALWTLMGAAQAGIFPASTKAIRDWFPIERRASANGLLGACMSIGGALAPTITARLLSLGWTWRQLLWLYAIPGAVWAVAFFWFARVAGSVEDRATLPRDAETDAEAVWHRILTSRSIWLLCAQQFLRAAAMIFFVTWFPTFLQKTRGVSELQSGYLTTLAGAGAVLGSILGGFTSDKVLKLTGSQRLSRQGIAVMGMSACAVLICAAHFVHDPTRAVAVIAAGTFCATFGGVSGYTVAIDFGGRRVATVFSMMNMCGNFGAMLFPFAIGWLVRETGNWNLVLFIFAGIFAVDAICWALLNPRQPLFPDERNPL
jgi:MFS family permease